MSAYKIRKEAADEIAEAAAWYEAEAGPDLAADLIAEYEARLAIALELPGAGTIVATTASGNPVRRYRLERFKRYGFLMAEIHRRLRIAVARDRADIREAIGGETLELVEEQHRVGPLDQALSELFEGRHDRRVSSLRSSGRLWSRPIAAVEMRRTLALGSSRPRARSGNASAVASLPSLDTTRWRRAGRSNSRVSRARSRWGVPSIASSAARSTELAKRYGVAPPPVERRDSEALPGIWLSPGAASRL